MASQITVWALVWCDKIKKNALFFSNFFAPRIWCDWSVRLKNKLNFQFFLKTPPCETTVHCCAAALVWCHFCDLYIYCNISLMHCIFGALHHWCYVFAPLVCYALASLLCIIVGALQLKWIIFWLQYFFGVMYLRCVASLVLCIYALLVCYA